MDHIESALTEFNKFVESLLDLNLEAEAGLAYISDIWLDLPVELEIMKSKDPRIEIHAGPPSQQIETSFMPILHHMKLRLCVNNE